jgi:uncharacterized membrane-anchored protein
MSEVVLLPNNDRSQQVEGLCQRLYTTTVKGFLSVYMFYRLVLDKGDNSLQPGDSTLLVVTAGSSQIAYARKRLLSLEA